MKSPWLLWIAIPLLTTLNQACLRLLAMHMKETAFGWAWVMRAIQTPWVIGITLCEGLGFVLWMTILANTGLGKATLITASAYVLIVLMSWTVFGEPIAPLQVTGSALILSGIWLIGTAPPQKSSTERVL